MKNLFVLLLFLTASALNAQTQGEMNNVAGADFQKADKKLADVYKKLTSTLDAAGKLKLAASEKAWLAYREAHAKFAADYIARGGTMASLIYNTTRTEINDARIKDLKYLLSVQ